MKLQSKFIEVAKKMGNKIAVYDQATQKDLSYDRMLIASIMLAKRFADTESEYVGVMVPTSLGCMLSILGVLMAGKIPVMINYATGAHDNAIYAQEKCTFRTIITSKKLLAKLNIEPVDGMIYLEDIMASVTKFEKLKAAISSKKSASTLIKKFGKGDDDDTCVILFTSGSEKEPKAVQLSHKNIFHNLNNIPYELSSDDIFLANLPLFHVFGLTVVFWLPISLGCSIVAYPNPLDYKAICKLVRDYKITLMVGTPSFFYGYLKKSDPGDFASIRYAVAGADKLMPHLYEGFKKQHGIELYEGYGTTETSPVISVNSPEFNRPGSVGKPMNGVSVRIVDLDTEDDLPPNKVGKILVKGDLVMKGYLGDIEETSLRIHKGWYDTGDMGRLDEDGYLWHCGRLKRFVKIGGEMISLVKVEDVLEKYLPDDTICCVVEVPNPSKGADIVAAVTTGEIEKRKILKQMTKELPSIAIPKEFHVIEDIPMMSSGKVNFREVEKICRTKYTKKR